MSEEKYKAGFLKAEKDCRDLEFELNQATDVLLDIVTEHREANTFMEAGRRLEKTLDRYAVTIDRLLGSKR